jgi:L1 cell adhesion molecule like protein
LGEENIKSKVDASKLEELEKIVGESLSWLDENQNEEKEVYNEKQKAVESVFMSMMENTSQSEQPVEEEEEGPKIEEID